MLQPRHESLESEPCVHGIVGYVSSDMYWQLKSIMREAGILFLFRNTVSCAELLCAEFYSVRNVDFLCDRERVSDLDLKGRLRPG